MNGGVALSVLSIQHLEGSAGVLTQVVDDLSQVAGHQTVVGDSGYLKG